MAQNLILDHSAYDLDSVIADIDEIRRWIPQRHEMEQLTAIVHEDADRLICVGYRDLAQDEFWTRGHMPGLPLMPGVLMCEAAGQLASYFAQKYDLIGAEMVGFGGLENVRFRGMVVPGDRLVIVLQQVKVRRGRLIVCKFQEFVREGLICEGEIIGIPLPTAALRNREGASSPQ